MSFKEERTVVTEQAATMSDQPAVVDEPPETVTERPAPATRPTVPAPSLGSARTVSSERLRSGPGGAELARRIVALVFGLIQIVIGLRIALLLLDARTGNAIVSGILNISQVFVGPFDGILRTNALQAGGSMLDVTAAVAFVGWTILELVVFWIVGIVRTQPDGAS